MREGRTGRKGGREVGRYVGMEVGRVEDRREETERERREGRREREPGGLYRSRMQPSSAALPTDSLGVRRRGAERS
jgi:hypothetical protein